MCSFNIVVLLYRDLQKKENTLYRYYDNVTIPTLKNGINSRIRFVNSLLQFHLIVLQV